MRLILFSMPSSYLPCVPPIGIACLASYLRKNAGFDLEIEQVDLNLDLLKEVACKNNLKKSVARLQRKIDELNDSPDGVDPEYYRYLINTAFQSEKVIQNVDNALNYFKNPSGGIYDPQKYSIALNILRGAYSLYFSPIKPKGDWIFFQEQMGISSLPEFTENLSPDRESLFRDFFKKSVIPRFIGEGSVDVVGISVSYSSQIVPAYVFCSLLKQRFPGIKVFAGGPYFSHFSGDKELLKLYSSIFDSIIKGEGEEIFLECLEKLVTGAAMGEASDIWDRVGDSLITKQPQVVRDLDVLDAPDYSDFDLCGYLTPSLILPLFYSRGCSWQKCNFCNHSASYGNCYRCRSMDKLIDIIRRTRNDYNCRHIMLVDEAIELSLLAKISSLLIDQKLDIRYSTMSRFPRGISEDELRLIRDSGCDLLSFGMESIVDRVLGLMNKNIRSEDIRATLEKLRKIGIKSHVMFFIGFPGETEDEARETCSFVISNKDNISFAGFSTFSLAAGSTVYKHPERFGVKTIGKPQMLINDSFSYDVTTGLSQKEAGELSREFMEHPDILDFSMRAPIREHVFFMMHGQRGVVRHKHTSGSLSAAEIAGVLGGDEGAVNENGPDMLLTKILDYRFCAGGRRPAKLVPVMLNRRTGHHFFCDAIFACPNNEPI